MRTLWLVSQKDVWESQWWIRKWTDPPPLRNYHCLLKLRFPSRTDSTSIPVWQYEAPCFTSFQSMWSSAVFSIIPWIISWLFGQSPSMLRARPGRVLLYLSDSHHHHHPNLTHHHHVRGGAHPPYHERVLQYFNQKCCPFVRCECKVVRMSVCSSKKTCLQSSSSWWYCFHSSVCHSKFDQYCDVQNELR